VNYFSKHREGLLLTVFLHLLLVVLLCNLELFLPFPTPSKDGVLIDFGLTDEGMGLTEPAPAEVQEQEEIPAPSVKKHSPAKKTENAQEKIVTQDFEKTAIINAQRKVEDQNRKKQQLEDKRIKDSIQQIEDERIAEINRVAEVRRQDSLQKVAQQQKINQINSRAKNVFGVSGKGTDPNSKGQGTGYRPGNQGSPDGVAGGGDGSGNGLGSGNGNGNGNGNGKGTGISYNLSGRKVRSLPKPPYPGNEEGIVVVEITVDKSGVVTSAKPGVKGSTSLNAGLMEAAKKAALSTKFNENPDAPAFQSGIITYHFVLD